MTAKYKEIALQLKTRILNGSYSSTNALPEQMILAKEFSTSRMTIQKALDILRKEGIIFSRQGSGTYIKQNVNLLAKLDTMSDEYVGLTKSTAGKGVITSEIIDFDIRFPNELEQKNLLITAHEPVYEIRRLRFLNKQPLLLEYTIMPNSCIPGITESVLYHSIYSYIEEELKLVIGAATRHIRADKSNHYDQKYLDCSVSDPILEVEQVVYLDSGIPFEYSKTRHRFDRGDIIVVNLNSKKSE